MGKLTALVCLLICTSTIAKDNQAVVQAFVHAFNAKDIDAMLEQTDTNIRWMYISGDQVLIETERHEQLRSSMSQYFETYPSSQSELISMISKGHYVQAIEKASWQNTDADNELQSQCSMSVYRLINHKIIDVWYYPAEACD